MAKKRVLVLATGGTIAGVAGSALRHDYRPGQIGIEQFLAQVAQLGVDCELVGHQLANIGSENMGPALWTELHRTLETAMADDDYAGVIVTHGTDTAEETAFLLDLTLPTRKPVVLVGAMRPADAVGSDGLRNFVNAAQVASDEKAAGRGVLVVMSESVFAARDVGKVRTRGTDSFRGYPRGPIGLVTPSALEWFGAPWRVGDAARFAYPGEWPEVPIAFVHAGMTGEEMARVCSAKSRGIVIAGLGEGNMPDDVRLRASAMRGEGLLVVRASRLAEGLVDRAPDDDTHGFIAARALSPQKSRIMLQLLIANGESDLAAIQRAFDRP